MKNIRLEEFVCISENVDLDKYISFRESVKEKMSFPEWLGDFTKEELEEMLHNGAVIWIYFKKEIPICSMMYIPSTKQALKKFDLKMDFSIVGDYGPMFVNFDYLGNGLQLQMLEVLDKYMVDLNRKYAIATIHPDNIYSIQNFIKDRFILIGQKEFKRGIRNIYIKDLQK